MALRKKGSRGITVDGVTYRWRLRGRPTYDQGLCWSPLTYAVELADEPGKALVVTTSHSHPGNWVGRPAESVLPAEVASDIRAAVSEGWNPGDDGSVFHLDRSAGFEPWDSSVAPLSEGAPSLRP